SDELEPTQVMIDGRREEDRGGVARELPAAATERQVDVLAHPPAEADVPAPPEVGDAVRAMRVVEVLGENHAGEASAADGDLGPRAEAEVDGEVHGDRVAPGGERAAGRIGVGLRSEYRSELDYGNSGGAPKGDAQPRASLDGERLTETRRRRIPVPPETARLEL